MVPDRAPMDNPSLTRAQLLLTLLPAAATWAPYAVPITRTTMSIFMVSSHGRLSAKLISLC